jgi:uncharacterized protein YbjT (DUF2867 family)
MLSHVGVGFLLVSVVAGDSTILVTGATGRTGLLVYQMLKQKGVRTRALVRNVTKAKELLNCSACDASEGIFEGDVTKKESMTAAMAGTTALAITTSAIPHCKDFRDPKTCSYPKGGYPVDVDFKGGKAQIEAFAENRNGHTGPVVLCSSMGTTQPDGFLETLGNGHIGFFKLNEEADLMSSGLPFTIVKPCGLSDDAGKQRELVVGHDDEMHEVPPMIPRADVARVMVEALLKPEEASGLRFDLCSKKGTPTIALDKVFKDAKYPWQQASALQI